MSAERRRGTRLRRGAYLVPSLFTIGNAFLGFYGVVRAMRGDFQTAALLIYAAAILDGLDGTVARLTGTESDFGREFDSLADVLTFGAAPALMAALWFRDDFGRVGWLIPLFYLLCAATRLARFNVQAKAVDSRYFVGLPSPAGAAAIAAMFLLAGRDGLALEGAILGALVVCGLLMVSTFRYVSVKKIDLRRRWSYRTAIPFAGVLLVLAVRPRASLIAASLAYALSGPALWAWTRRRRSDRPAEPESSPDTDDIERAAGSPAWSGEHEGPDGPAQRGPV